MNRETLEALDKLKAAFAAVLVVKLKEAGLKKEQIGFLRAGCDNRDPERIIFYFAYMTPKGRELQTSMPFTREEAELGSHYCLVKLADTLRAFADEILELYQ
jgi:hypothetical protein